MAGRYLQGTWHGKAELDLVTQDRPWALTHCPRSSTQVPQVLAMADTVQALLCVVKTEPLHRGTLPTLWPRCLVDI